MSDAVFRNTLHPEDKHELESRDSGDKFVPPHSYNSEACSGMCSLCRWKGLNLMFECWEKIIYSSWPVHLLDISWTSPRHSQAVCEIKPIFIMMLCYLHFSFPFFLKCKVEFFRGQIACDRRIRMNTDADLRIDCLLLSQTLRILLKGESNTTLIIFVLENTLIFGKIESVC